MRTRPISLALFATALMFAAGAAWAASYAPGKSKPVPGAEIFDNQHVLPLRIEIAPNELKALQQDNRRFVRATVREGTNVWKEVGLHVKGAAGSTRDLNDKPALTLAFAKFTPGQRFHGLRKIHLNNSVQDGSYLTENICSELFRKAGVPTPRVSYATLELNGKKKGLYVLKEGFTREMLGLYFQNPKGNLYDGGFLREVTDQLERDTDGEDDVRDWSDLKALARAAQEPDLEKRWAELNQVLDVDRFISFTALEVLTWDWDGYVLNRNNYRVYHDLDTGRMVFFPHGMDQMFWETGHPMLPPNRFNGLVARAVIEAPQGRKLYRERFGQLFTNVFQIETLTNRVSELATLLRPYVGNTNDYNNQEKRIRDLIVAQHGNFARRLSEPPPQPLSFASGIAKLKAWEIPASMPDPANAKRDRAEVDGRKTLHILTTTNTAASWRSTVLLSQGKYRFEALAKVAGVESLSNTNKGAGAGIRHSKPRLPRSNKLEGDSSWQPLTYDFQVPFEEDEIQLLCELRAAKGEVWFDLDSLRLVKLK